jgi:hypothetical protein
MVIVNRSLLYYYTIYVNHFSSFAQLKRSLGENFQGAKFVSMFWKTEFQEAGDPDSSMAT